MNGAALPFVTASSMQALDRQTIDAGTSGEELMDRAGRGIAARILSLGFERILFVAGQGNNGGDAFAASRYLHQAGKQVIVWRVAESINVAPKTAEAQFHLTAMRQEGITDTCLDPSDWPSLRRPLVDCVVDCLLGTGASGPPRGIYAEACELINRYRHEAYRIAVDLPTGMDADSGEIFANCVEVEETLSLGFPKTGFTQREAWAMTGSIRNLDIGIRPPAGNESTLAMVNSPAMLHRPAEAHKGSFGRVLLIGGSREFPGAIDLATRAALRSGAGLVNVFTPHSIVDRVAQANPEAMVRGLAETDTGSLDAKAVTEALAGLAQSGAPSAILAGLGMTTHPETRGIIDLLLTEAPCPIVLDADALNVLAGDVVALNYAPYGVILTPHPGEMARLMGRSNSEVQADRLSTAMEAAARSSAVVILKGAGTIVAQRSHHPAINLTGNPGMGCGGSGDVLAGLTAGLVAQGLQPGEAAHAAVYWHGDAGDRAAIRHGQASMKASDIVDALASAMRGR